jgi:5-(carboxyamino)imidazole ribonucleotide synthase
MINILGDCWAGGEPRWEAALAVPGCRLHLYGKREPRIGRKMGHVTCLGASVADALERAVAVAAVLGIEPPK